MAIIKILFIIMLFSLPKAEEILIKNIIINGSYPLFNTDVITSLSIRSGSLLDSNKVSEQSSLIKELYNQEGYSSPEVVIEQILDNNQRTCDIIIDIKPGHYSKLSKIEFSKNNAFSSFCLKLRMKIWRTSLLPGQSGRFISKDWTQDSVNLLKHAWKKGYADCSINSEIKSDTLLINVNAGSKYDFYFKGNESISDRKLKKSILTTTKGNENDFGLRRSLLLIKQQYKDDGFDDIKLKMSDTIINNLNRVITIQIEEGKRISPDNVADSQATEIAPPIVSSVVIEGLTVLHINDVLNAIQTAIGEPLIFKQLQEDRNTIFALVSETGRPHTTVEQITTLAKDSLSADVKFIVNEGKNVFVGNTIYRGNFLTEPKIIDNAFGLKKGDPFVLSQFFNGQTKIRNLGLFKYSSVKTKGLNEKLDTVDLLFELEENKPYWFEAAIGYNTNQGIAGRSAIGNRNVWGLNKQITLKAEASQLGVRGDIMLNEPNFFSTQTSANLTAFAERRQEMNLSFGVNRGGALTEFKRPLMKYLSLRLQSLLETRNLFGTVSDSLQLQGFTPRNRISFTSIIEHDSRNSFIYPRKGGQASFSIELSKSLDGDFDDFVKIKTKASLYLTPTPPFTIAMFCQSATIKQYGNGEIIAPDHLLFLGGSQSVRGYAENLLRADSTGVRSTLNGSLELHYQIGWNIELFPFIDAGRTANNLKINDLDDFRFSSGIGVRYLSFIGPIGLLYGRKLNYNPQVESAGRFHLSFGASF